MPQQDRTDGTAVLPEKAKDILVISSDQSRSAKDG
jgi:hypothetical protein